MKRVVWKPNEKRFVYPRLFVFSIRLQLRGSGDDEGLRSVFFSLRAQYSVPFSHSLTRQKVFDAYFVPTVVADPSAFLFFLFRPVCTSRLFLIVLITVGSWRDSWF